jgi:hypothetical protein
MIKAPKGGTRWRGKFHTGGRALPDTGRPAPSQKYRSQLAPSLRPNDPAIFSPGSPPNFGRATLPHLIMFSGMNTSLSRSYRHADEAMRDSIPNAHMMLNDPQITEPLFARMRKTALYNWHIEPGNSKDPEQKALAKEIEGIIKRTPYFTMYRFALQLAIWYGRYANENQFGSRRDERGRRQYYVSKWTPVSGDKLVFRYDDGRGEFDPDQVGIRVSPALAPRDIIAGDRALEPTAEGMAYFLEPWEQKAWVIHKHMRMDGEYEDPLSAGKIHGVGLRSFLYWIWLLKQEALAQLTEIVEKSARGFTIYWYPSGNDTARDEVEKIAREQAHQNIILMPKDPELEQYGIDNIEPNIQGLTALQDLIKEHFGHQIKRLILGQTLSSEADATGMGSGVADLHMDTLMEISKFDSLALEETLTRHLVAPLRDYNYPRYRHIDLYFKIDCDTAKPAEELDAAERMWRMGVKLKTSEVMDRAGFSKPDQDDEVLQNPQILQQMKQIEQMGQGIGGGMGMGGDPAGPAGSMADWLSGGDLPSVGGEEPQLNGGQGTGRDGKHFGPIQNWKADWKPWKYANRRELLERIRTAADETDVLATDAQKKAGNYRKGKFSWNGLRIAIETPKGAHRRPEWPALAHHYGEILRNESEADGDNLDVFVGNHPESDVVFVVDQQTVGGHFDEHKVMIGFLNAAEAREGYLANYSADWKCGPITALTVDQFKAWLADGDTGERIEKQVSKYAKWEEEKHPRGNPDNPGQFASGKGGASTKSKSPAPPTFHGTAATFVESIRTKGLKPADGAEGVAVYTTTSYGEAIEFALSAARSAGGFQIKPGDKIAIVNIKPAASAEVLPIGDAGDAWHLYRGKVPAKQIATVDVYDALKMKELLPTWQKMPTREELAEHRLEVADADADAARYAKEAAGEMYHVVIIREEEGGPEKNRKGGTPQKHGKEDWTPYTGPSGGKGWKNIKTGKVVYGTDTPWSDREAAEEEPTTPQQPGRTENRGDDQEPGDNEQDGPGGNGPTDEPQGPAPTPANAPRTAFEIGYSGGDPLNFAIRSAAQMGFKAEGATKEERAQKAAEFLDGIHGDLKAVSATAEQLGFRPKSSIATTNAIHGARHILNLAAQQGFQGSGDIGADLREAANFLRNKAAAAPKGGVPIPAPKGMPAPTTKTPSEPPAPPESQPPAESGTSSLTDFGDAIAEMLVGLVASSLAGPVGRFVAPALRSLFKPKGATQQPAKADPAKPAATKEKTPKERDADGPTSAVLNKAATDALLELSDRLGLKPLLSTPVAPSTGRTPKEKQPRERTAPGAKAPAEPKPAKPKTEEELAAAAGIKVRETTEEDLARAGQPTTPKHDWREGASKLRTAKAGQEIASSNYKTLEAFVHGMQAKGFDAAKVKGLYPKTAAAVEEAYGNTLDDALSRVEGPVKRDSNKDLLDKAIGEAMGSESPEVQSGFRELVGEVWKRKQQEASELESARREIVQNFYGGDMGAFTRSIQGAQGNADKVARFDQMVEYAETHHGNIFAMAGRGGGKTTEDQLMSVLGKGKFEMPAQHSPEVIDEALSMFGAIEGAHAARADGDDVPFWDDEAEELASDEPEGWRDLTEEERAEADPNYVPFAKWSEGMQSRKHLADDMRVKYQKARGAQDWLLAKVYRSAMETAEAEAEQFARKKPKYDPSQSSLTWTEEDEKKHPRDDGGKFTSGGDSRTPKEAREDAARRQGLMPDEKPGAEKPKEEPPAKQVDEEPKAKADHRSDQRKAYDHMWEVQNIVAENPEEANATMLTVATGALHHEQQHNTRMAERGELDPAKAKEINANLQGEIDYYDQLWKALPDDEKWPDAEEKQRQVDEKDELVAAAKKPKEPPEPIDDPELKEAIEDGRVQMRRAAAGGETSDVNGEFYRGGRIMPVHGQFAGLAKPKSKAKGESSGEGLLKSKAEEGKGKGLPTAKTKSPEDVARAKAEQEDREQWAKVKSGPLGELYWTGDKPGKIGWNVKKNFIPFLSNLSDDKIKQIGQWTRDKNIAEEVAKYIDNPPAGMTADDVRKAIEDDYESGIANTAGMLLTKKLQKEFPSIGEAVEGLRNYAGNDKRRSVAELSEMNDMLARVVNGDSLPS